VPPELLNNDPDGLAWRVWHDRTPKLVGQVRDAHPYGPAQRRALDALLTEIASGVIEPLPPGAHDQELWTAWGAEYFGKPWQDAPFLSSEVYFYRRLLDAVGYFAPGPWYGVDPFAFLKAAELRDPALEPDLAALDTRPSGQTKLLASLWGNRVDLSFRIDNAVTDETAELVADDSDALWAALPADEVVLVADNAGLELLSDLVLIDHFLVHGQAATVSLHVKPQPFYVSDATTADVVAGLRRLAEAGGAAAEISHRLWTATGEGRLRLTTHAFYCAPWAYDRMPPDLAAEFSRASLTIFKGDLNYRRLVRDLAWPATTPFAEAVAYFPGPVAALRTLKSDVAVGIATDTLARLDERPGWRVDGDHGLVQVR
jgi:hypothetical protein